MICANNMVASKKKSTNGMLLSLGVCMMISYGTFGMKKYTTIKTYDKKTISPLSIANKILGENEGFKKCIDNIGKIKGFKVKYAGCCCWRGNVCDAVITDIQDSSDIDVKDLVYYSLYIDEDNKLKQKEHLNTELDLTQLVNRTGIYNYFTENNINMLNNAIKNTKKQIPDATHTVENPIPK